MPYSNRRPSLRERARARNSSAGSGRSSSGSSSSQNRKRILKDEQFSARSRTDFKGNVRRGIFIGIALVVVVLLVEWLMG